MGTRTYLALTDPNAFRPAWTDLPDVRVDQVEGCPPSFYRFLYTEVGRDYGWIDRLIWSDERIASHLAQPGLSLWVMYVRNAPAGYFELRQDASGSTELAYFGLLPEFIGHGLGRHLLSVATERAFEQGARRVWLHTCTNDHPVALTNYERRGFVAFKTEQF